LYRYSAVNGDAMTTASSSGALATATVVYEGVRARMEALKNDVARRDQLVTKLEVGLYTCVVLLQRYFALPQVEFTLPIA
jgi:hypothetical protein